LALTGSHIHYKDCKDSCQHSTSEKEQDKLETTNQLDNLTWADLTIIDDEQSIGH